MNIKNILILITSSLLVVGSVHATDSLFRFNYTKNTLILDKSLQALGNVNINSNANSTFKADNVVFNDDDSVTFINKVSDILNYKFIIDNLGLHFNKDSSNIDINTASNILTFNLSNTAVSGINMNIDSPATLGNGLNSGLKFSHNNIELFSNTTPAEKGYNFAGTQLSINDLAFIGMDTDNSAIIDNVFSGADSIVNTINVNIAERSSDLALVNEASPTSEELKKAATIKWFINKGYKLLDPSNSGTYPSFGPVIESTVFNPITWSNLSGAPTTYNSSLSHTHSVLYQVVGGNCNNTNNENGGNTGLARCIDTNNYNNVHLECPEGMFIVAGWGNTQYSGCFGPGDSDCYDGALQPVIQFPSLFPSSVYNSATEFDFCSGDGDGGDNDCTNTSNNLASGWIMCAGSTKVKGATTIP